MARPPSKYPTERELTLLQVLWKQSPLKARDVGAALADKGLRLNRSTVVTTLNAMVHKKYLKRKKHGHLYLYSPRVSESKVTSCITEDVVARVFDGLANELISKLLDHRSVDEEELRELRRTISQRLKKS